jgi:hypothetical protein
MILSKKVIVKIGPSNFNYYKSVIENIKSNENYEIDISSLNPNTHQKIEVKCDVCENISQKPYREYLRSYNNKGFYCCSPKCAISKNKETNLQKYGCENPFQSEESKVKIKETNLIKYGVEYPTQSEYIRGKIKQISIERYGVENPAKCEIIQIRMKNTCFERFGSSNYTSSKLAKSKRIENKLQIPDEVKTDFQLYTRKVRNKTNRVKKQLFESWNGLDYYDNENIKQNLALKYYSKNYPTIDHKISIYYGFINNIEPEIIGDLDNLCITKRSINSSKNIKCS